MEIYKGSRIAKTILKQQKLGGLTSADLKIYYKATVIKIVRYQNKKNLINNTE